MAKAADPRMSKPTTHNCVSRPRSSPSMVPASNWEKRFINFPTRMDVAGGTMPAKAARKEATASSGRCVLRVMPKTTV